MKSESKENLVNTRNHSDPELANHTGKKDDGENEFDEIIETVLTTVEKKV